MNLGKGASMGEILSWPLTCMCGEVAHMSDACTLPHDYGGNPQTLDTLMHLLEEWHVEHYSKEE